MRPAARYSIIALVSLVLLIVAGATLIRVLRNDIQRTQSQQSAAIPVEASPIVRREISEHKTFSATLEASAEVILAPKIQGRVVRVTVDLGDEVSRGQVIAELDSAEYEQIVLQARAELAVTEAQLVEARNASDIAGREQFRI